MNWRNALTIGVLLTTPIFAACNSAPGSVKSPAFSLPAAPAYLEPVEKRRFKPGADAREIAAQRNAELDTANSRLVKSRRWYATVRAKAGGDK